MPKSWQQKMADKEGTPKILTLYENFPCYNAAHRMGANPGDRIVLVNPREVEALMRQVPDGKVTTLMEICTKLARDYNVQACCTLTAGIFTMTAANAAEEMKAEGKPCDLAWWRTLKAGGELNPKYSGGVAGHAARLEGEGFTIVYRGKKAFVRDFDAFLHKFA